MAEDKKLKKLNLILQAFFKAFEETHLSKEEFTKAIKVMVDHIKKIEARNEKVIEDLQKTFIEKTSEFIESISGIKVERKRIQSIKDLEKEFASTINKIKEVSDKGLSDLSTEIRSSFEKLFKEQNNTLNFMRDKVRNLTDGKDADEEMIIESVLEQIVLPELPEPPEIPEFPKEFDSSDILETLESQSKDIDALKKRPMGTVGGGVTDMRIRQAMKYIVKTEALTGDIDGANLSYTVTQPIFAVFSFSLSGEFIAQIPNYTISDRTITFTTALPSAYSGKDFEITYI